MARFVRMAAVSCLAGALIGFPVLPLQKAAAEPSSKTETTGWTESYDGAKARAKADKKLILADFTGSDWCHFCIQLKKEVLDTQDFKKWAGERVVLLELDYPHKKQDEDIKKQNAKLKDEFKIEGYPTIIVMNSDGKEVGRIVGYGGAKEWSQELQKIVK